MPKPTTSRSKKVINKKTPAAKVYTLPVERSQPFTEIEDFIFLLYGERKIGKTSFASMYPSCFVLATEAGGKSLSMFQRPVASWEDFIGYVDLLVDTKHDYKNVCIDTGAELYERCSEYVCEARGVKHPNDANDYGATWKAIAQEFSRQHLRLFAADLGIIIIAHSTMTEVETRTGAKYNKIRPLLTRKAEEYYVGIADIVGYYHYDKKDRRCIQIAGDNFVEAGCRLEKSFKDPVTNKRIKSIPMGKSKKQAYKNFVAAFNNELQIPVDKQPKKKA